MKNVILTICFLILLSFFSENLLPQGKMKTAVRSVFSCLAILCVLSPIKNILEGDFSFENLTVGIVRDVDYDYTEKYYNSYCKRLENGINTILEAKKIDAKSFISYTVDKNYKFIVEKVTVKIDKSVINSENDNIYVIEEIKKQISDYLGVPDEKVKMIYE